MLQRQKERLLRYGYSGSQTLKHLKCTICAEFANQDETKRAQLQEENKAQL
jgi:hypothetical protein